MLYDLTGKALRTWPLDRIRQNMQFSLVGLADGTYLFEIEADGMAEMKKMLKLQ